MGDFAKHLSEELWRQSRIDSEIVVFRKPTNRVATEHGSGWHVRYAESATTQALIDCVMEQMRADKDAPVLLHYGPYAYSSDGIPAHFAEAIGKLGEDGRLVVFFHEMWAQGWPWKRAFWTRQSQRRAVQKLLASSRCAFTSSDLYMRRLQQENGIERPLKQIRIFSNIGELEHPLPLSQREPRLVVFGQFPMRARLYRNSEKRLELLCHLLQLRGIVDAGSGEGAAIPRRIGSIPVERIGFLGERKASELMATSVAGVVRYGPSMWEKSGVLAAYRAHGMLPVVQSSERKQLHNIAGIPILVMEDLLQRDAKMSHREMQLFADHSHACYLQDTSLRKAAERIAAAIASASPHTPR